MNMKEPYHRVSKRINTLKVSSFTSYSLSFILSVAFAIVCCCCCCFECAASTTGSVSSGRADHNKDAGAVAGTKSGSIHGRVQYPDGSSFNNNNNSNNTTTPLKIVLNHGEQFTYTKADGRFVLRNIPPGTHVLDVHDPIYHFSQIKVQFLADDMDHPKMLEYYYPGALKQVKSFSVNIDDDSPPMIVWTPLATYDYFEKRHSFNAFAFLKSPMILFMIVSAGLMFLMPKMMEGLDPEEKERMKKQMAMQSNPTEMFSSMFRGDWSALTGDEGDNNSSNNNSNSNNNKSNSGNNNIINSNNNNKKLASRQSSPRKNPASGQKK